MRARTHTYKNITDYRSWVWLHDKLSWMSRTVYKQCVTNLCDTPETTMGYKLQVRGESLRRGPVAAPQILTTTVCGGYATLLLCGLISAT